MTAGFALVTVLLQSEPVPSQVFVLRISAKVEAAGTDGSKLVLRPRIRMAVGDNLKLSGENSRVILVSLKSGRREELSGKGTVSISAAGWAGKTEKSKRLPDMDLAFLSKTFNSQTKVREKLGEVVRATDSLIPIEVRRPMGAIPLGPTTVALASWQGIESQKITVWEGDRVAYSVEAKKGASAVPIPSQFIRPGQLYRWEAAIQSSGGLERVSAPFHPIEASLLTEFQAVLKASGVFSADAVFDPDLALAVVNRAMELGMYGIALDIMTAALAKSSNDELMKIAREQLIKELEAIK